MNAKERAAQAKLIIENPLWELAREDMKDLYARQFRQYTSLETRERLALAHDMCDEVFTYIEAAMALGEAELPLEQEQTPEEADNEE